jgi:hypothetical protein
VIPTPTVELACETVGALRLTTPRRDHTGPTERQGALDVDEVLFGVLAENIGRYLDGVDRRAGQSPELRRLVAAWRALLDLHRPAGRHGRCAGCAESHRRRRNTAMCNVWRVANAFFIRPED